MAQIKFIFTDSGVITAFANNEAHVVAPDHPNYKEIKQAIKDDDVEKLVKLVDIPKSVQTFTANKAEVKDGVVYYDGKPLHNAISNRILALMQEGFPFEPMLRFIENLMQNPSSRAVNELYTFLMNQHLPITEDGHFLAYKRVREDWLDFYSGTFDNSIGNVVEIPRNQVDDNFNHGCSHGLHIGAIEYVHGYHSDGHIVIVKVNPKDVVSVPLESNCTKCRTCRYEVIGEYAGDLTKALYTERGQESTPTCNDYPEDDDYDDEDEDDEDLFDDPEDEDDEDDDDWDEDEEDPWGQ